MREFVLDASAVLALMFDEPGQEIVAAHRAGAMISAVNHSEVLTRLIECGQSLEEAMSNVTSLQLTTVDHSIIHAAITASLRPITKHLGASYGDRACLSLAIQQQRPILTADQAWAKLNLGIEIHLIR